MAETQTMQRQANGPSRKTLDLLAVLWFLGIAGLTTAVFVWYLGWQHKEKVQPWHFWIAPAMVTTAIVIVIGMLPVRYYFKVWRLKHFGR